MVGQSGKLLDKRIQGRSKHKRRHKHWVGHNGMGMGFDTNCIQCWRLGIWDTG